MKLYLCGDITIVSMFATHCINIFILLYLGKDSDTYPSPELSSEPSPACTPPLQRSSTPSDSSAATNGSAASFAGKLPSSLVGKLEDNHSYFSSSGFALDGVVSHKDVLEEEERLGGDIESVRSFNEVLQDEHNHQLLTDALPNINTSEDWAAAFGFAAQSREHELLQSKLHQQQRDVGKLCDFLPIEPTESFAKGSTVNDKDSKKTVRNGYSCRSRWLQRVLRNVQVSGKSYGRVGQ